MTRNRDARRSAYAIRGHARAEPTTARVEMLGALGATLIGPAVAFELLIVDGIPPELSGRYRPARSHIAPSHEGVALSTIAS